MFEKKIVWPKYQLIAKRIKVFSFEEIKTPHTLHNGHKQKIKLSLEKRWITQSASHRSKNYGVR
jgi:preprotein translocase subunit SecB